MEYKYIKRPTCPRSPHDRNNSGLDSDSQRGITDCPGLDSDSQEGITDCPELDSGSQIAVSVPAICDNRALLTALDLILALRWIL
ncbi:hypothetical protein WG66_006051 [Moniliophthora roreri]|nr:hypothetical protein WG66_006051 [Moniliophthora roreri]